MIPPFLPLLVCATFCLSPHRSAAETTCVNVHEWAAASGVAVREESPHPDEPLTRRFHLSRPGVHVIVRTGEWTVSIDGLQHWLSSPGRASGEHLWMAEIDVSHILAPMLLPQPPCELRTVVLDPGHGGRDRGAFSRLGHESFFTLDVANRTRKRLGEAGYRVVMTREEDRFVPLETRAAIASRERDAVLVSIHFNASVTRRSATGFEVFCLAPPGWPPTAMWKGESPGLGWHPGNKYDLQSVALASAIHGAILSELPQEDRGIKRARFAVLRLAQVPSVLIEAGFLSSPQHSRLVGSPVWREHLARAIVEGVNRHRQRAAPGTL